MISTLSLEEAKDLIDIYGPDEVFWPAHEKSHLRQLVANDVEFRQYVEDAKWLEDMLANWDQVEDGAAIDFDDWEDPMSKQPQAAGDDESDDGDDGFGGLDDGGDRMGSIDDIGERDDGDMEHDDRRAGAMSHTGDIGAEEEDDTILVIDADDIKDMDGMLTEYIKQQAELLPSDVFRVFTRDYDQLQEIKVGDNVPLEAIDQAVAQSTGPLQKDLRRLIAARSQSKRLPGKRSGRIHAPNLHRIMAGDDRVFYRREEAPTLDTAISLVIDSSGSMAGRRMKLSAEAAYAIATVLNRLGVAFECIGFTDSYEHPILRDPEFQQQLEEADKVAKITRAIPLSMPKFKTFDERWNQPVMKRFAQVYNADGREGCGVKFGSTPEGCGIEFAARRLLARKEKRKIMIVMTDGEACGHIYNARWPEDANAYENQSKDMVQRIEASGIDLIGVGIQHSGPTEYYPNSMVINTVDEMPKQLLDLLKKFILG